MKVSVMILDENYNLLMPQLIQQDKTIERMGCDEKIYRFHYKPIIDCDGRLQFK